MGKHKKPNRYNIAQPKRTSGGSGSSGLVNAAARRQIGDKATNNVVSTESDARELTLAINEQEFNNKKQHFVGPFINELKQKLQDELNKLQAIDPVHQRDIVEIEAEIRKAETERNDAMTNASKETDPAKKAQFIATAQAAERTIKQAKARLAKNPLSKLAQYSYINDMGRLFSGNISNKPVNLPSNNSIPDPSNPREKPNGGNNPNGGQNT
ncbi:9778_t:CDS:2 [Funneliformis geosporum]|nr:9778_t:CDS:2 [Funneliformis geosporum]